MWQESTSVESSLYAKFEGTIQFDGLRTVHTENAEGKKITVVIGRTGEVRTIDVKSDRLLNTTHIPYGSVLNVKDGQKVAKGDVVCTWDPFNNVIVAEVNGKIKFEAVLEGITYRDEADEQTGHREKWLSKQKIKPNYPSSLLKEKKRNHTTFPLVHTSLLMKVMM